jgi:hypothetical protein
MDSRTRQPRQRWLTTAEPVSRVPNNHAEACRNEGSGADSDCPASSLMERVFAFLDSYGYAEESALSLKGQS